jgi:hypothetical protein
MRGYLLRFALATALLLSAAAGFIRLVDPFGYWAGPRIDGFNALKPSSGAHLQSVKLRQIERSQPRTLVAGNSRVDVGFDPASAAWPVDWQPVFNLGLPGAGPGAVAAGTVAAMDRAPVRRVFVGVDFVDFLVSEADWRAHRLKPIAAAEVGGAREMAEVALSLDALGASLAAIPAQRDRFPAHITDAGFNGLAEYNELVATEGHHALFAQRAAASAAKFRAGPKAVAWPAQGGSAAWDALAQLAAECRRRGVELVLFTYPYHVTLEASFAANGLGPAYTDWRRRLTGFAARERLPLHDFVAGLEDARSEAIPAPGDTATRLRWYWEGGHFKAALGDRMIAEMAAARLDKTERPR